jgi:hypothetical protein
MTMETIILTYLGFMGILGLGFILFGIVAIKELNK